MPLTNTLARTAVKSVTVRSTLTPDIVVDPFASDPAARRAGAAEGGPGGLALSVLRPAIYVETPAGVVPIEPWGSPDDSIAPILAVGAAVGLAALAYFAWRGLRRR